MKQTSFLSMLAFVLIAVLAFPSQAMAGSQRTTFTGTSSFGESINPGEWTFHPDGSGNARGITEVYHDVNTDPRVTGDETVVYNFNFRPAPASPIGVAGRIQGTFHVMNDGGRWDGTWTAEMTDDGEYFARGVAHGSGGYEGLIGHWDVYSSTPSGPFTLYGWILQP